MTAAIVALRTLAVRAGFLAGSRLALRRRILLATSHQGALSGNMAFIAEELAARQPPVPVVVLTHRRGGGILGGLRAAAFAVRAGYQLATARAVVVDDYFLPLYVITPREGTARVQVWHASGAFKKFGYSVADKSFGANEATLRRVSIHANYTLALVSSMSVAAHYAEAFGQPEELFTSRLGIPRTDLFFDEGRRARAGVRIRAAYGLPDGRRVLLYAPTFRGDSVVAARFDDLLDLRALHDVLGDGWVVLLKLHPFIRRALAIPPDLARFALDASADPDLNELMLVSDVLVTDYSSAIYEFSLLGRPILFLAPDLGAYERERGFYLDFPGDLPGPVFATTAELAVAVRAGVFDLERVRAFARASFDVTDGGATARLVDEVLLPALRGGHPAEGPA